MTALTVMETAALLLWLLLLLLLLNDSKPSTLNYKYDFRTTASQSSQHQPRGRFVSEPRCAPAARRAPCADTAGGRPGLLAEACSEEGFILVPFKKKVDTGAL